MKTSTQIRRLADGLEQVLRENSLSVPNWDAIRQIRNVEIVMSNYCPFCTYRAARIVNLAEEFYAEKDSSIRTRDASALLGEMEEHLSQIRAEASFHETQGS